MSIIRRRTKPKHAKRRLELSSMKEALKDRRIWACLGLIVKDGSSHFEIDPEGDVLMSVKLLPDEDVVLARLASFAGGAGEGIWGIPPVGTEVMVVVPDGELACGPVVVATLSTGSLPASEGITENRIVIIKGEVFVHDGSGGVHQLVTKEAYEEHLHPTGTGPSGVPNNATAPTSYTQVFKAQ